MRNMGSLYVSVQDFDKDVEFLCSLGLNRGTAVGFMSKLFGVEITTEKPSNDYCMRGLSLHARSATPPSMVSLDSITNSFNTSDSSIDTGISAETPSKSAVNNYLTTFGMTTSTAGFAQLRYELAQSCKLGGVRFEEVLNFFDFKPANSREPLTLEHDFWESDDDKYYLLVKASSAKYVPDESQGKHIVFLIDVSGSMRTALALRNMWKSMFVILTSLSEYDRVSFVTYSKDDNVLLQFANPKDLDKIVDAINGVEYNWGCTNGSGGLTKAYQVARRYFKDGWVNRIVMMTDGDFNFGLQDGLSVGDFVAEQRKHDVSLSILGIETSHHNLNDDIMFALANRGNGVYYRIADDFDILQSVQGHLLNELIPAVEDVKIQVEFNPAKVKSYKLLGYSQRELAADDFEDDTVKAEPINRGCCSVALFEIELGYNYPGLRYYTLSDKSMTEVAFIKARYAPAGGGSFKSTTEVVYTNDVDYCDSLGERRLAEAVKLFWDCQMFGKGSMVKVLDLLNDIDNPKVTEFRRLILETC